MKQLPRNRKVTAKVTAKAIDKMPYVAPSVEVQETEEKTNVTPSEIILDALQLMRKDVENRMACAEDEHKRYMQEQLQRLGRIDEIIGGMTS